MRQALFEYTLKVSTPDQVKALAAKVYPWAKFFRPVSGGVYMFDEEQALNNHMEVKA